jgi:hypothetical protein
MPTSSVGIRILEWRLRSIPGRSESNSMAAARSTRSRELERNHKGERFRLANAGRK